MRPNKTDPVRGEQDEKILRLRIAGLSLRAIGQQVGLSHQGVADRITASIGELVNPAAEEYRALEALRLDDLARIAYGVLAAADTGDLKLKAVDRLTKLSESRRKLWALDMPQQLDVALSHRNDVAGDLVSDALIVALEALDVAGLDGPRQEEVRRYAIGLAQWKLTGGEGPRPKPLPASDVPNPSPGSGGTALERDVRRMLAEDGISLDEDLDGEDGDDD
jgi:hypothetical protein